MSFAHLSPEERRVVSSKGGKGAHAAGKAHTFTHEEAVAAGRKSQAGEGRKLSRAKVLATNANKRKRLAEARAPQVLAQQQRMAAMGLIDKP